MALVTITLSSTASWLVRIVMVVGGTALMASVHAHWKAYDMPKNGTP